MIPLIITPNLDKAPWEDLRDVTTELGKVVRVGRLPRGTTSGKSTVYVVIEMPDGKQYIAETTMTLFLGAATAMRAADEETAGTNRRN